MIRKRVACCALALFVATGAGAQVPRAFTDSSFASLIASLSESPGYFDTDNLISNEDSYLHAVGTLRRLGVAGGAYVGVGPDQNFSYIAAVRPDIAFIIDIRRDNLLHHLLLKSIFSLSRSRIDYLSLLFGREPPADTAGWGARTIDALLTHIESTTPDAATIERVRGRVLARVRRTAVPLSPADFTTISRFHTAFIAQGPALRFNTHGRAPQPYYPTFRQLITETDRAGQRASFLARESDFATVKSLQDRNLVVPVVGDFAGPRSVRATGDWLRRNAATVSVFYTSNVEQYLFRSGTFDRFAASVISLPRAEGAVMIRSYFQGGHPQQASGYHATQLVQPMDRFAAVTAAGGFAGYRDLVLRDLIRP